MNGLYDPLTYETLIARLVVHFERQPRVMLRAIADVPGPGIYVLLYDGNFENYERIAGTPQPIYVW